MSKPPANPRHFGQSLCKALGTDITRVKEIVLRCAAGEAVTVQVTRLVQEDFDLTSLG